MPKPPRSFLRRWTYRIVLAGFGVLLAGLLAEVAVLLVHGEQVKFPRHVVEAPWGLRYNEPGSRYRHSSPDVDVTFRINGQGMRADADYAYEKSPGTLRIVCLGDSYTTGYEVEEDECFVRLLERELQGASIPAEVLNAGVSGFSTAEALLYLERELYKYEPDAVVLSFYVNDLVDNLRADLFRLDGDELVENATRYVPLGGVGNFLNSNWLFNFLSERSNAFVFAKENVTRLLQSRQVEQNLDNVLNADADAAAAADAEAAEVAAYQRRLEAALVQRMRTWCADRGIAFVLHSIPTISSRDGQACLVDAFPYDLLGEGGDSFRIVRSKDVLDAHVAERLLYHERSHWHWTPFAHATAARSLAEALAPLLKG